MSPLSNRRVFIPGAIALAVALVGVFAWQSSGSDGERVETRAENCPPIARNDAGFTAPTETVTIDVLANDTDAEGDALVLTVLRASDGSAEVDDGRTPTDASDDLVLYTPSATPGRTARIDYRIEDATGGTSTAEVIVAITELGALPGGLRSADPTDPNGDIVDPECLKSGGGEDEQEAVTPTSADAPTTSIDPLTEGEAVDPAAATSRGTVSRKGTTGRTTTTFRQSTTTVARSGGGSGPSPPPSRPVVSDDPPPTQTTQTTRRSTPTSRNDQPCHDEKSCQDYWRDYESPPPTRPPS